MLTNQVILIKGDRITDRRVRRVAIPPDAQVIDLSAATVLPGMIDAHVHLFPADNLSESTRTIVGVANAQTDLNAGFTTVLDMDSRGGFGTVDLRNAINRGLVMGPRMQVVGQSLNQRASVPYPALFNRFADRFTEDKNVNSPWLGRAAVREAKLHGVDWVKIYTTQDFVGDEYERLEAGRHARQQSVTDRGRSDGDRGRGASPWPEGRLSHLRRRRPAQLSQGRCRRAQSSDRSR